MVARIGGFPRCRGTQTKGATRTRPWVISMVAWAARVLEAQALKHERETDGASKTFFIFSFNAPRRSCGSILSG